MAYVVWIDHEEAMTLPLESGQANVIRVAPTTPSFDHFGRMQRSRQLFDETAKTLSDAKTILLTGPGLAKHLFVNHMAEHHPRLFRKVVGCIDAGHHTADELRTLGKTFFRGRGGQ